MEHKSVSIADQVFEKLERDILSGLYRRGEVLTENKLCEQLGVSRTPVREALRRLEQEHIVSINQKGITVIGISKEDMEDIYEIRERMEGLAARRAAQNADADGIAQLQHALELQEFYVSKKDVDNIKNMDNDFHASLYRMTKSAAICDTLTELHKKVIKYRKSAVSNSSRAEQSLKEHRAIFEAIAARDGALAEQMAVAHVKNARNHIPTQEK